MSKSVLVPRAPVRAPEVKRCVLLTARVLWGRVLCAILGEVVFHVGDLAQGNGLIRFEWNKWRARSPA